VTNTVSLKFYEQIEPVWCYSAPGSIGLSLWMDSNSTKRLNYVNSQEFEVEHFKADVFNEYETCENNKISCMDSYFYIYHKFHNMITATWFQAVLCRKYDGLIVRQSANRRSSLESAIYERPVYDTVATNTTLRTLTLTLKP
jgi:hypothetical protein